MAEFALSSQERAAAWGGRSSARVLGEPKHAPGRRARPARCGRCRARTPGCSPAPEPAAFSLRPIRCRPSPIPTRCSISPRRTATLAYAELAAAGAHRPRHRHDRASAPSDDERLKAAARHCPHRPLRQHEPRRQPARRAGPPRGRGARAGLRHRDRGDAPPPQGGCALRHRAASRPRRRGGARHRARGEFRARARRPYRRAAGRRDRLRHACAAARSSATTP